MHALSSSDDGHVLALIAVGNCAVADVHCCRWPPFRCAVWCRSRHCSCLRT